MSKYNHTVLVVDDDWDIIEIISIYLKKEGYKVITADHGKKAIQLVIDINPHLIILDRLLPDTDGIEVCKSIRKYSLNPIIFLTCKDEDCEKIMGLNTGGDDYITKPFNPNELVARVNAHLRRYNYNKKHPTDFIAYDNIFINLKNHKVWVDNIYINLSAKEYKILTLLITNPGKLFTMSEIYENVWKDISLGDNSTIMVHISNIRKKIEKDPSNPKYITTVRGQGYMFNDVPQEG